MSEHKVSAGTMLLFIDPNGGTEYDTVICLRSVSITDSVASIDISSWCGPGKLPGLNDITLSFDGFHVQDPNGGNISGTDIRILLRNNTTIGWKLSPESPIGGDEIQTGQGFIASLSSTYSFDAVGSFNFTINVKGDVTTEIVPNFYLGMPYEGGFIAYIDESGIHGLIRADVDYISIYGIWSNDYSTILGATSPNYGDGESNTNIIIANDTSGAINTAALYCHDLNCSGYTGWFLPALNEITAIDNSGQIPSSSIYWTSTEIDAANANEYNSYSGNESSQAKYALKNVIPVRYF